MPRTHAPLFNITNPPHHETRHWTRDPPCSCDKALKDVNGEAAAYTNSGHEFYLAEIERSAANEPTFEEYVGEATQCYLTAIALYLRPAPSTAATGAAALPVSQSTVPPSVAFNAPGAAWTATAGSLYHELATLLQRLGRCGEACTYFLKAAEIHQGLDQFRTTLASLWAAVDASITGCLLLQGKMCSNTWDHAAFFAVGQATTSRRV